MKSTRDEETFEGFEDPHREMDLFADPEGSAGAGALEARNVGAKAEATDRRVRFERFYREHRDAVYRAALRYAASNPEVAQDIAHDVFMIVWQHVDRLDAVENPRAFLRKIAVNASLRRLRRERLFRAISSALSFRDGDRVSDSVVTARAEARLAQKGLDTLEPKQRLVFCLVVLEEQTLEEAALAIGISKGYASKLLTRAQASLRACAERGTP